MDFTEHTLKAGIKFILATKEKIKDLELRLSFFNIVLTNLQIVSSFFLFLFFILFYLSTAIQLTDNYDRERARKK